MRQQPQTGSNRTGISTSPELARDMQDGTREFPPTSRDGDERISKVRATYAKEGIAFGSIPSEVKKELAPLIDKLGARLAFERTGTRLYEGLIDKLEAYGSFTGGPEKSDLERIRDQEREHFEMLTSAIAELGGDPTAVTPSADLQLTVGQGVPAVIADPRTSLLESLEAILVAELADNDSWQMLMELARKSGQQELASSCQRALLEEQEHLESVRTWLAAGSGLPRETRH